MKIIVALGNPGEKFKKTRHNIAWLALDYYLGDVKWQENKKFNSLVYKQDDLLFVKPLTYMNNSGHSVLQVLNYYKLIPKNLGLFNKKNYDLQDSLLVIHDDVDIEFGKFKLSYNSSSGGHNGIKSILNYLNTQKFNRLRLGIKNDLLRTVIPTDKFVLQNFNKQELNDLNNVFKQINFNEMFK
jgi:PTH1 family peptidyl-tRNA hydrolase